VHGQKLRKLACVLVRFFRGICLILDLNQAITYFSHVTPRICDLLRFRTMCRAVLKS
jgi:hypothetical protein